MADTYTCGFHPERGELTGWCPACVKAHENRQDAEKMSGEARGAELRALVADHPLSRPFELIHKRAEELVGHPVWTHEFASRARLDGLCEEARTRAPLDMEKVIGCIPSDKKVIILEGPEHP